MSYKTHLDESSKISGRMLFRPTFHETVYVSPCTNDIVEMSFGVHFSNAKDCRVMYYGHFHDLSTIKIIVRLVESLPPTINRLKLTSIELQVIMVAPMHRNYLSSLAMP